MLSLGASFRFSVLVDVLNMPVVSNRAELVSTALTGVSFVLFAGLLFSSSGAFADTEKPLWYRCLAKASSHSARYTFKINTRPCEIYWREIDTALTISECNPPVLSGLKPSARDQYSIVWFNLETGAFYDYLSGIKDRGWCTASEQEPKP